MWVELSCFLEAIMVEARYSEQGTVNKAAHGVSDTVRVIVILLHFSRRNWLK